MPVYDVTDYRQMAQINLSKQPGYSGIIDAYGNAVPDTQEYYTSVAGYGLLTPETQTVKNPRYQSTSGVAPVNAGVGQVAAPTPVQYTVTFDTIGQTIPRATGLVALPLRLIWAQGVDASGDVVTSPTLSFAAAMCWPIVPFETGTVIRLLNGVVPLYDTDQGGIVPPPGLSDANAALLAAAVNSMRIYPGTESQLPDSLIVADKGADRTNAFRNLRYLVVTDWPLVVTGGIPTSLTVIYKGGGPSRRPPYSAAAVEFAAGSG